MRRARIKAVASIPIRRKAAVDAATKAESEKPAEATNEIKLECKEEASEVAPIIRHPTLPTALHKQEPISADEREPTSPFSKRHASPCRTPLEEQTPTLSQSQQPSVFSSLHKQEPASSDEREPTFPDEQPPASPCPKPLVEQTPSLSPSQQPSVSSSSHKQEPASSDKREPAFPDKQLPASPCPTPLCQGQQPPASPVRVNKAEDSSDADIPKISNESDNKVKDAVQASPKFNSLDRRTTSLEASPIKAFPGRSSFPRPVPRLDGGSSHRVRRNSSVQGSGASASESEDDYYGGRRSTSSAAAVAATGGTAAGTIGGGMTGRARNDSVCSLQSAKEASGGGGGGGTKDAARLNLGQKRRTVMSESARKLAEARREFLMKHENKSPDKAKLTMYDLIYYNPAGNPMKARPPRSRQNNARKISVSSVPENPKNPNEEEAEEPAEMLVPQIKVGPNGQLIIDEQSLVINQYKAQENIDRSDILVDEDTNGNGFYKRRQKSKDWNKWETIKFYKALNTYGTDFSLMHEKFPLRSRMELKIKYKKEEKINRPLIDKALKYQEFDVEALEKEIAGVEERERKENEIRLQEKENLKKLKLMGTNTQTVKKKRKRCNFMAEEVNCENDVELSRSKSSCEEHSTDDEIVLPPNQKRRLTKKAKTEKPAKKEENINSGSETDVYKVKKTRSGRISKKPSSKSPIDNTNKKKRVRKRSANTTSRTNVKLNELTSIVEENQPGQVVNSTEPDQAIPCEMESYDQELIHADEDSSTIIIEIEDDSREATALDLTVDKSNCVKESKRENQPSESSHPKSTGHNFALPEDLLNLNNLQPGALVVLKNDNLDDPEKATLQVYIVSADYVAEKSNYRDCLIPLSLDPAVLETVTDCIKDIQPKRVT